MMTGLANYLVVGALLFTLGAIGFLTRRNLILMVLSVELMLQGVAINFVAFGRYHGNHEGQSFTIFLLTVAACEAALALALVLAMHGLRRTLDVQAWSDLGETPTSTLFEPEDASETGRPESNGSTVKGERADRKATTHA